MTQHRLSAEEKTTSITPGSMDKLNRFKRRQPYIYTWIISILCFLFVIFLAFLGGGLGYHTSKDDQFYSRNKLSIGDTLRYNSITGEFRLGKLGQSDVDAIVGVLAADVNKKWFAVPCDQYSGSGKCIVWKKQGKLVIEKFIYNYTTCYDIDWQPLNEKFIPRDCFKIGVAHWYGGAEVFNQRWPIETGSTYELYAFLPGGRLPGQPGQSTYDKGVVERYWLSSNGVAVKADDSIPLHVSWDDKGSGDFCLVSKFSDLYPKQETLPRLKYKICQAGDIKSLHEFAMDQFFPKPKGLPDLDMLQKPIWSTWAKYHVDINETTVLNFTQEILSANYSHSQIEIDDMFSTSYGELDFDEEKFPNATGMIDTLKELGFNVTVWVTPFTNIESPSFKEGMRKGYWVMDSIRTAPVLVKWWDGVAGILDVTNPDARKWYVDRLTKFQQKYRISSFKFDAGSSVSLPSTFNFRHPLNNTAYFTHQFVDMCGSFGSMVEVRVGYRNQDQPIFFRVQDFDSTWSYDNGLKNMIPKVLHHGIIGYPFVLPDMIGGNAYNGQFPERELFIRWMELSAFLPSWQFSITPGQYDDTTVVLAKKMMTMRETFVNAFIVKYAKEAVKTGAPIIRPLWWIAPTDAIAQIIDDEFLVGNDVLVAPIIEKGGRSRRVYLPAGKWCDQLNKANKIMYNGNQWLEDFKVDLDQIAYFSRNRPTCE